MAHAYAYAYAMADNETRIEFFADTFIVSILPSYARNCS